MPQRQFTAKNDFFPHGKSIEHPYSPLMETHDAFSPSISASKEFTFLRKKTLNTNKKHKLLPLNQTM